MPFASLIRSCSVRLLAYPPPCRELTHRPVMGQEPRQSTSNVGHIQKPSIQALIHGLNRHYYSIAISTRKTELEEAMLLNLHKQNWSEGLRMRDFEVHKKDNEATVQVCHPCALRCATLISYAQRMLSLANAYQKSLQEEAAMTPEQLKTRHVGKQDPKRHLEDEVERAMGSQISQSLATVLAMQG